MEKKQFISILLFASVTVSVSDIKADDHQGRTKDEQTPPAVADQRVAVVLDTAEVAYRIDEDKDFQIVKEFENGRTQQVWVKSVTNLSGDAEMREVWSYAYQHKDTTMPGNMLNRLMYDNNRRIMGAWVKQGQFMVYVVRLPADAVGYMVVEAINEAAEVADYWEQELSGGDAY